MGRRSGSSCEGSGPTDWGRGARAFRRRPGQAVAASETPASRGLRGKPAQGRHAWGRHGAGTAGRCRVCGRDGTGCRAYGDGRHKDGTSMEETAQVRRVRGRDGTGCRVYGERRHGGAGNVTDTSPSGRRIQGSRSPCGAFLSYRATFAPQQSADQWGECDVPLRDVEFRTTRARLPRTPRRVPHRIRTLASPRRPGHFGGGHSLPGSPPKWPGPLAVPCHRPRD